MELDFVRSFIRDLETRLRSSSPDARPHGFPFEYRRDEGALFLTRAEIQHYRRTLDRLVAAVVRDDDLSASTVSAALSDAIFEALDLPGTREDDFSTRLDAGIRRIRELDSLPAKDHECLIEVSGMDMESLPAMFGSVRFVRFSEYQERQLLRKMRPASSRRATMRQMLGNQTGRMLNHCYGVIEVCARDDKAAIALANRQLRRAVDALNFFTDWAARPGGWLSLPGERGYGTTTTVTTTVDGLSHLEERNTHPIPSFSMKRLRQNKPLLPMVRNVSGLLRKKRSEVEELLLTAVETSGRATVATRPEQSFLLYAIALESLVLAGLREELRYRLSHRVARVLERNVRRRVECSKRIKKLYDIRSKIVHSGSFEVVSDLDPMRRHAKTVILKLLSNAGVRKCQTRQELNAWFERQELR